MNASKLVLHRKLTPEHLVHSFKRCSCFIYREKATLQKSLEQLNTEMQRLRSQQDELVTSRNDVVQQVRDPGHYELL